MRFIDYIKDKVISFFVLFVCLLLTLFLLIFLNAHILLIIFIPSIILFSFTIYFIYDFYKRKTFYNYLIEKTKQLDKKYLITEIVNRSNFLEANLLIECLYDIDKSYVEDINKYKYSTEELKEYIELWCHEIKTPIATTELIIDNNRNSITENIGEEINKIEGFVEQVLYYARSENVEQDYIITKTNLKEVIQTIIKKNKKDLINKKIKVEVFEQDIIVASDFKWLEFIINQIIINSIKYSKEKDAYIKVSYKNNKNNVMLFIEDNGIGIDSTEIEKVFNKGFTGTNGRKKYNSTGIGLYLCKKLCDKLGHNITISSKINEKTTVTIIFPNNSLIKNNVG